MGRLCGGAHEISDIKAPLFLHGGWLEGSWGGWMGGWWWDGWLGGGGVGGWGWGWWCCGSHDTPLIMGASDATHVIF